MLWCLANAAHLLHGLALKCGASACPMEEGPHWLIMTSSWTHSEVKDTLQGGRDATSPWPSCHMGEVACAQPFST